MSDYFDVEGLINEFGARWFAETPDRQEVHEMLRRVLLRWRQELESCEAEIVRRVHEIQRAELEKIMDPKSPDERLLALQLLVLANEVHAVSVKTWALSRAFVDGEFAKEAAALEGQALLNEVNDLQDKVQAVPAAQRHQLDRMLSDAMLEAHFCIQGRGPKSMRLGGYRRQ